MTIAPVATGIRAGIVVFAVAGITLLPTRDPVPMFLALLGIALAVAFPAIVGAWLFLGAEALMWVTGYGLHTEPSILTTLAFALVLYLAFAATALAAAVPLAARVSPAALRVWTVRCVPGVLGAIVAAAGVGLLGRTDGSRLLDIAGLVAAVVALLGVYWLGRASE